MGGYIRTIKVPQNKSAAPIQHFVPCARCSVYHIAKLSYRYRTTPDQSCQEPAVKPAALLWPK